MTVPGSFASMTAQAGCRPLEGGMAEAYQVYGMYLWAALTALFIILAIWVIILQRRINRLILHYNRLIADTDAHSLEDALNRYVDRLEEVTARIEELDRLCRTVEGNVRRAIQRVGIVRFNPFADTGSDQSFAVALLDLNGSGVVLSSLFSRTSTRIFAKPIQDGKSTHALTDEEREAIDQAMTAAPAAPSPHAG